MKGYTNAGAGGGTTPTGKINITTTAETNVADYATAQVVDANLVAGNIKQGVSVLGVSGTFTSDANAAAGDILSGKSGYVNGSKINGSITSKSAATYTPTTADQTISAGQYLSGAQTIKGDANLIADNIKDGVSLFGITGSYSGLQQPKLASLNYFQATSYAPDTNNQDLYIGILNGIYGDTNITFELYRDDVLLIPSSAYNIITTWPGGDYKQNLSSSINLRAFGLETRGTHYYKMCATAQNFESSDFTTPVSYQMYASKPQLSLAVDTLTITSNDTLTDQYKIYVDGVLKTTINKTASSQTFDLTTLQLASGTYSVTVVGAGTNIQDSRESVGVTYVVINGYTVTTSLNPTELQMSEVYIKLNSAPTSDSDNDYGFTGDIGSYDTDIPNQFLATDIYIWGDIGEVTSPISASIYGHSWSNPIHIALSGDTTLGLTLYYDT